MKFFRHRLADLVQQDPASLVRHAQIAGQRQGVLAFDLIHKHGDRGQIGAQRGLVGGKQRAAGDGEVLAASLAAEAQKAAGTAGAVGVQTAAMRANRRAVRFVPADFAEGRFRFPFRHAENLSEAQGPGGFGLEEVDGHWLSIRRF